MKLRRFPRGSGVSLLILGGIVVCGIGIAGCDRGGPHPDTHSPEGTIQTVESPWFENVYPESGMEFAHQLGIERRHWFPEVATGGAGTFDYDNDGLLDLYMVQGGDLDPATPDRPGNRLYRNVGGLRFEDVTEHAGVGDNGYGMGCAAGDYDGDGHVDLYVTNVGPNVLYRNHGDRTFRDVTQAAKVGSADWGSSAAFVDYDVDGDLDLYLVNYVQWSIATDIECFSGSGERGYCGPNSYQAPVADTLYRNDGHGSFTDVSEQAGILKIFGNGLGIACADLNQDGRIDFYVANDGMPNQLWINGGDGTFTDEALTLGCAVSAEGKSEAGMGVQAVDIDHDGDLDLYLSHLRDETNTFYLNNGAWFDDTTARLGLARPSYEFTGFGLGFVDFDHDGRLDIYVANGRVKRIDPALDPNDVYAEPNLLFVPSGEGLSFREFFPRGGTQETLVDTSRAAVFGDLDNDGDVDIVVVNMHERPYLLRNVAGTQNWIMFRVLTRRGGYALHASLELTSSGGVQRRQVQRAYSYCASNDPRVHFGLGDVKVADQVTVRWPEGGRETFGPYEANKIHEIRQGTGRTVNSDNSGQR